MEDEGATGRRPSVERGIRVALSQWRLSGEGPRVARPVLCLRFSWGWRDCGKSSTKDLATFLRRRSTIVFECPVPPSLRQAALNDGLDVRIAPHKNLDGAHPRPLSLVQRSVTWPDSGPKIGACAWVKGGAYHDRDGNVLGLPAARVAEWLAHLRVLGVGHVLVTDNSDGVFAKALRWSVCPRETSPLSVAYDGFSSITVVPWPSLEDDQDQCSPQRVEASIIKESNATSPPHNLCLGDRRSTRPRTRAIRRLVAAGSGVGDPSWMWTSFLVPPPSLNAEKYLENAHALLNVKCRLARWRCLVCFLRRVAWTITEMRPVAPPRCCW